MSEQPSQQSSPEVPENNLEHVVKEKRELLESLTIRLGFIETAESIALRNKIAEGPGKISYEILMQWKDLAEALVSVIEDKELFRRAQIGLLLAKAQVYLDAGMPDEFYEDIDDAITYASGVGLEDVVEELQKL